MNRQAHVRQRYRYLLIFFLGLVSAHGALAAPGTPVQLLSPVAMGDSRLSAQVAPEQQAPFIKRTGEIFLDSKGLFQQELAVLSQVQPAAAPAVFRQMHLLLSFFPEQDVSIIVDSQSHSADNILSLAGHELSATLSTFSMTISQHNFLITYQDLDKAMTYRVIGDVTTGRGRVVEIDLTKIPPTYDSAPVVPRDR